MIVRTRIGELLKERGLTVIQLAEQTGLNYRTALDLSKDKYDRIGLDTIGKLCEVLQVQPGDLFETVPQ